RRPAQKARSRGDTSATFFALVNRPYPRDFLVPTRQERLTCGARVVQVARAFELSQNPRYNGDGNIRKEPSAIRIAMGYFLRAEPPVRLETTNARSWDLLRICHGCRPRLTCLLICNNTPRKICA